MVGGIIAFGMGHVDAGIPSWKVYCLRKHWRCNVLSHYSVDFCPKWPYYISVGYVLQTSQ